MTLEIFVPFWGDPALLFETVDSVRAQRNPDWRLVVIDDCYPDEPCPRTSPRSRTIASRTRATR